MGEKRTYDKSPKVYINGQGMAATIRFPQPGPDEEDAHFTVEVLLYVLKKAGVVYGIDQEMLLSLCSEVEYDTDYEIAHGMIPREGKNGFFEYHFSREFSNRPTIREDGSADFLSIKVLEVVHEGELIVTYHPAVQGEAGMTVRGVKAEPKIVRDMPPIGGRGFHRSEDDIHYYSDIDGKIVVQGPRILISPVYEIDHDADLSVGNIDFKGDIVIHGGVKNGIKIRTTGSITVHGLVEHCQMEAGRDIFLLAGVKGAEKTTIRAGGQITAEFIEYADVSCKKDLRAEVLFNCQVECDARVIVTSGKRSAIIGGEVTAIQGISALTIGNHSGAVTHICVGIDEARLRETMNLSNKIEELEKNISRIKTGIEQFDEASARRGASYKNDPRRLQLLRVKIRDEAILAEDRMRLEELKGLIQASSHATVRVYGTIYAGVTVKMRDHFTQMSDYQEKVELVKTDTGIRMDVLDEPIPEE